MSLSKPAFVYVQNKSSNWPFYKMNLEAYAYSLGAEGILDGTEEEPEDRAEKKEYIAKKRVLYSFIINTQSEDTLLHVGQVKMGDVKNAYKNLLAHYESQSKASIKQMMSKLVTLKMEMYVGVPEYVHAVTTRLLQLKRALIEQRVDLLEVLGCSVLLDGLSGSFAPIATLLLLDDTLVYEEYKKRVLEAGERIKYEQETNVDGLLATEAALKVGNTGPVCSGCGKTRHNEANCWVLHPELKEKAMDFARAKRVVEAAGYTIGSGSGGGGDRSTSHQHGGSRPYEHQVYDSDEW